jgi:hypothetical protein
MVDGRPVRPEDHISRKSVSWLPLERAEERDTGPAFWIIMTVGGAVLVGVVLAYGVIGSRRRRENPKK